MNALIESSFGANAALASKMYPMRTRLQDAVLHDHPRGPM